MSAATLDLINQVARRVERVYEGYQMTLKALLGECMDRGGAHSHRARVGLAQSVVIAGREVAKEVMTVLEAGVDQVEADAEADVEMDMGEDVRLDFLRLQTQAIASIEGQVRDATRLDGSRIVSTLRATQLKALMRVAQGVTDPDVAFDMVKGGTLVGLSFTRLDRAGKAWSSSIHVRTLARALMVGTYTETYLTSLLSNGYDIASVPGDDGQPILFSITGTDPNLPSFDAIQAEYLHPNASRLVSK